MNKIRIIDLLNKIANGEEVPKKIKYLNYKYEFNQVDKEYQRWFDGVSYGLGEDRRLDIILDDEVEILEEETTVSEEQVLFNNLTTIDQEYVIRIMKMLQQSIDYLKSKGE